MKAIEEQECMELVQMVRESFGMNLENKRKLLSVKVVREMERLHYECFSDYLKVLHENEEYFQDFLDITATGYTYFFREREQFRLMKNDIIEKLSKQDTTPFRIWSAGCATGEECYTLAIIAKECMKSGLQRPVHIVGTDIAKNGLHVGQVGTYKSRQLMKLPAGWKKEYFVQKEGSFEVKEELRDMVEFHYHNLMEGLHEHPANDVIFCRNVLSYMDIESRKKILGEFYENMRIGGYLFLGNSETIHYCQGHWKPIGHSVYKKICVE